MNDDRYIIWSNYNLDYKDWKDDLEAEYPDKTENELMQMMCEINGDYLDDERSNLNVQLSRPILVIADLGRWNGRFQGYKEIGSGNIRDCLYSDTDYSTWYVDKLGDLRCDTIHHDGTNHYLFLCMLPVILRRKQRRQIMRRPFAWHCLHRAVSLKLKNRFQHF